MKLSAQSASRLVGHPVPRCEVRDAADHAVACAGDTTAFVTVLMGDLDLADALTGSMMHYGERLVMRMLSEARGSLYAQRVDHARHGRVWQVTCLGLDGQVVWSRWERGHLRPLLERALDKLTQAAEEATREG